LFEPGSLEWWVLLAIVYVLSLLAVYEYVNYGGDC